MINSGSLEGYKHQDLTPVIGREFEGLQVKEILAGDEQLMKDLVVTSMKNLTHTMESVLITWLQSQNAV